MKEGEERGGETAVGGDGGVQRGGTVPWWSAAPWWSSRLVLARRGFVTVGERRCVVAEAQRERERPLREEIGGEIARGRRRGAHGAGAGWVAPVPAG
ncbi:hypothetical protein Nepgr_025529 [Nepenthes gracilis]|uniref:Uncharacterized protein n=1 Tax=Nepenthes gracilis TaxID=150966 RepID=A0AAD3Y1K9_NEPGR|nr:hypothetical protein Nepgr_025529 [Nepenthes gracilis]